ncbi:hypothetical protein N7539_004804 [Penicillium diatomitis]|uniref:Copper transport protein n=1 Tax=Penicillium diatomitis TaxID=2819901 RepID=A0A9X0BUG7_9EURO|nr:uncharacterized protein N7539_004804 [Penicillium diatomitis]KAJ5484816.1 hypothetical protein N7539_004804 [Penicillium diatomitis]
MDHGSMSGMDMGSSASSASSSSGASSAMGMTMAFTNAHSTHLFSAAWTPSSSGTYAATCIFLIVLAIIDRCLVAFKATMERHWLVTHLNRRYIAIAGKTTEAGRIDGDPDAKAASLITAQGVEENVKLVHNIAHGPIPWRFSVDLPRAILFLFIVGVSYLLMLAVMTMNVGYFCSVLTGAFIGDLAVGRYIQWNEHNH